MEISEILSKCDHTLLTQTATWADIKGICDDGMKYHTASVCIPASFVRQGVCRRKIAHLHRYRLPQWLRYHRRQVLHGLRCCGQRRG